MEDKKSESRGNDSHRRRQYDYSQNGVSILQDGCFVHAIRYRIVQDEEGNKAPVRHTLSRVYARPGKAKKATKGLISKIDGITSNSKLARAIEEWHEAARSSKNPRVEPNTVF